MPVLAAGTAASAMPTEAARARAAEEKRILKYIIQRLQVWNSSSGKVYWKQRKGNRFELYGRCRELQIKRQVKRISISYICIIEYHSRSRLESGISPSSSSRPGQKQARQGRIQRVVGRFDPRTVNNGGCRRHQNSRIGDPQAPSQPQNPHLVVVGTRVWWRVCIGVSWLIITGHQGDSVGWTPFPIFVLPATLHQYCTLLY